MPPITSFFTKKKRFRSSSSELVFEVIPPKKARTDLPALTQTPSQNEASSCHLPCCDLSSAVPKRVPFDKFSTARIIQKKSRYFQPDWLEKNSWLSYCKTENKAYCQTCRYVVSAGLKKVMDAHGANAFTSTGFTNWRTASEQFSRLDGSIVILPRVAK